MRDDVQIFRDLYNVERLEVLHGPNAMIFGRGGGGGVVNRVPKRPTLDAAREPAASGDGDGGFRGRRPRPAARPQSRLPPERNLPGRRQLPRPRRFKRWGINPTVALLAGRDTRSTCPTSISTIAAPPIAASRPTAASRCPRLHANLFGDPRRQLALPTSISPRLAIEHDFRDGLTLRNRTMFGDYDKFYQNIYPTADQRATGLGHARRLQQSQRPARTCSARPISSGRTGSAASTRRCCSASSSAMPSLGNLRKTRRLHRRQHRAR